MSDADPLLRFLDEGRRGSAGEARERERTLRRMAEEGASLGGALLDLAERGSVLSVRTEWGRSHHGVVAGVGADFIVLRRLGGGDVLVRTGSVVSVRPHTQERHAAATGDRPPPLDVLLVEVLARVAPDRPRMVLVVRGGELVAGELRAVGGDVVTMRLDGDPRQLCYLAAEAVVEVTIEER